MTSSELRRRHRACDLCDGTGYVFAPGDQHSDAGVHLVAELCPADLELGTEPTGMVARRIGELGTE